MIVLNNHFYAAYDTSKLVTTDKKKTEVISNFFLPRSSLITAHHIALKCAVWKEGPEEEISFPL